MPNENGTQTIDADEKQTVALVDHETPGSPSEERPGKQLTPYRKTVLAISGAMVVAIAGGYFAWNAFRYEDTDDAQIDGHVMQLSARINGHIKDVYVVEGQLVHAGDVLVTVDPQDYKIAEAQAQANLADAEATAASYHWKVPITSVTVQSNLDSAKTGVINAEAGFDAAEQNYESAKAVLAQAEANAAKSDADLERYKQLVAKEDISRQQYDQAVATATANRAAVVSAQAGVHAAEQLVQQARGKFLQSKNDLQTAETAPQQISLTRANAQAADAQVLQRKAQLAQAEMNLSYTVILVSRNGNCRQEKRRSGPEREYRTGTRGRCASRRCLGHRQFQGDAARPYAPRSTRRDQLGCIRPHVGRPRHQSGWWHRLDIQLIASRKCHR